MTANAQLKHGTHTTAVMGGGKDAVTRTERPPVVVGCSAWDGADHEDDIVPAGATTLQLALLMLLEDN